MASATAVWYSAGLPAVPIRWVLVRDPQGEFKTQALLCTDLGARPEQILRWFVMRWQMETTFQEALGEQSDDLRAFLLGYPRLAPGSGTICEPIYSFGVEAMEALAHSLRVAP
jgi:hypothetical protein